MIWLIGNKGMLGTEIEVLLKERRMDYIVSDQEIDITNPERLQEFAANKPLTWIINCASYTAVDRAEDEPELARRINADGPLNIAQVAAGKGAMVGIEIDGSDADAALQEIVKLIAGKFGEDE